MLPSQVTFLLRHKVIVMAARGIITKRRWCLVVVAIITATAFVTVAFLLSNKNMDADYIASREIASYASRHNLSLISCKLISKDTSTPDVTTFDYQLGEKPRHEVRVEVATDGAAHVSRMIDE